MDSVSKTIDNFYESGAYEDDISFEEIKLICTAPFKMVKEIMSKGELKDIRLQYFGVFEVSGPRVKWSKNSLQNNFNEGLISERRYNDRMLVLNRYEEKNKD